MVTLKQGDSQFILQLSDVTTDSRLLHAQGMSGSTKTLKFRNRKGLGD
jgi:hypothetical protein